MITARGAVFELAHKVLVLPYLPLDNAAGTPRGLVWAGRDVCHIDFWLLYAFGKRPNSGGQICNASLESNLCTAGPQTICRGTCVARNFTMVRGFESRSDANTHFVYDALKAGYFRLCLPHANLSRPTHAGFSPGSAVTCHDFYLRQQTSHHSRLTYLEENLFFSRYYGKNQVVEDLRILTANDFRFSSTKRRSIQVLDQQRFFC